MNESDCRHENVRRTPIYIDGQPTFRCVDCGALAVDEAAEPVTKLVPLASGKEPTHG